MVGKDAAQTCEQAGVVRDRSFNPEVHFLLTSLMVHPSRRGLGLGSRLLCHGLEIADKVGAKVYLESTTMGLPLYTKHRFRLVDEVEDPEYYEAEGFSKERGMVREASRRKSSNT